MTFFFFLLGLFWARYVMNWKPKHVWEQIESTQLRDALSE